MAPRRRRPSEPVHPKLPAAAVTSRKRVRKQHLSFLVGYRTFKNCLWGEKERENEHRSVFGVAHEKVSHDDETQTIVQLLEIRRSPKLCWGTIRRWTVEKSQSATKYSRDGGTFTL